jgi:hypothetical protein
LVRAAHPTGGGDEDDEAINDFDLDFAEAVAAVKGIGN